jgi:DNA processing protein
VAAPASPFAPRLDDVAASMLRAAADTLSARVLKELPRDGDWLARLATRVVLPPEAAWAAVVRARADARLSIERARATGQRVIAAADAAYPELLRHIADPPIVLWIRGDPSVLSSPAVAIVGARDATPAGLLAAQQLGRDLAAAGLVVVSGMARGVDGAAHRGAIEGGGRTVAVLGSGADVIYPRDHATLADQIVPAGAIVSELRPGTQPRPYLFPLRNRIISGLVKAVVVIEASERSGSLITARQALEQGRDVLAVPGGVASGRYRGSHRLIKDGARLVESVEDVLDEIGWPRQGQTRTSTSKSLKDSSLERNLHPGEPSSVDELAARTGRPAADLLAELTVLELAGRVARVAGGGFVRLD